MRNVPLHQYFHGSHPEIAPKNPPKKTGQKKPKKTCLKNPSKVFLLGFFKDLSDEPVKWTIFALFLAKQQVK